jgi:hypothetical protein
LPSAARVAERCIDVTDGLNGVRSERGGERLIERRGKGPVAATVRVPQNLDAVLTSASAAMTNHHLAPQITVLRPVTAIVAPILEASSAWGAQSRRARPAQSSAQRAVQRCEWPQYSTRPGVARPFWRRCASSERCTALYCTRSKLCPPGNERARMKVCRCCCRFCSETRRKLPEMLSAGVLCRAHVLLSAGVRPWPGHWQSRCTVLSRTCPAIQGSAVRPDRVRLLARAQYVLLRPDEENHVILPEDLWAFFSDKT